MREQLQLGPFPLKINTNLSKLAFIYLILSHTIYTICSGVLKSREFFLEATTSSGIVRSFIIHHVLDVRMLPSSN